MLATKTKYDSISDEIEQYKLCNIALQEELNETKENISTLQSQNERYLQMKANLQNQIDKLSQIIKSKQMGNENENLQNQIRILEQQKEKMKSLEEENAKQNEIINEIKEKMEAQSIEKKALENELERLQSQMDEYLLNNDEESTKYIHLNEQCTIPVFSLGKQLSCNLLELYV